MKITFILLRMTIPSLALSMLLKGLIRNAEIYYVEVGRFFRKMSLINNLEKLGMKWVKKDHNRYAQFARPDALAVEFADLIYEKIKKSYSYKTIKDYLGVNEKAEKRMAVAWKWKLHAAIRDFASQYAAAEHLIASDARDNIMRKIFVIADNSSAFLLKDVFDRRIKIIFYPGIFDLRMLIRFLWVKIPLAFRRKKGSAANDSNAEVLKKHEAAKDNNFEVVFFPHQAIFYGDFFIKDQYYSEDINSPLHKTKILHISMGEGNERYMHKSYAYYIENNIRFADINDLPLDKKGLTRDILKLIKKNNLHFFADAFRFGIRYLLAAFHFFYDIRRYFRIFSRFKKLKIVLAGYDCLFPLDLSFTFSLLGVKVCASQERFIQAFYPSTYMIFDNYFSASDMVGRRGLKNSYIENCIPLGLVRVDRLFDYEIRKIPDEKYDNIKISKKLVLAFDYLMPADVIEDVELDPPCKIINQRRFYNDMIRLSLDFPAIHIVIKCKFADTYKSLFLQDIVERIANIDNIEIMIDFDRYNPYYLAEKADLSIVCHTSLADELLAAGRAVVFYELSEYMETFFNYNNLPVIVKDYEGLNHHVRNILNGNYLEEEIINKLKNFYSNCYHGNVCQNLRSSLERLI